MEWSVEVTGPACPTSNHLNLIKSRRKNFDLRQQVRRYYKHMGGQTNSEMSTLFIFGKSAEENNSFNRERDEYGDFIIGNFEDTYQNLPLKTFSGSGFQQIILKVFHIYAYTILLLYIFNRVFIASAGALEA